MQGLTDVINGKRTHAVAQGDCLDVMQWLPDNCIDTIITDPPYDNYELPMLFIDKVKTLITFMPGEAHIEDADEYHYWLKPESTKNFQKKCGRFVERIAIFKNGGAFNPLHWSQMTGVHRDRLVNKTLHPFQKPLTLMERLIRIYTNEGDLIVDPMCGSGTVLLAALRLNRRCIGIELEAEMCEISRKRIEADTPLFSRGK